MDPNNQQQDSPPNESNQYQAQPSPPQPNEYQAPAAAQPQQNQYQAAPPPAPKMFGRPSGNMENPLEVMSPGERVLCHINRHSFGLFGLYAGAAVVAIAAVVIAALVPHYVTNLTSADKGYLAVGIIAVLVIVLLYLYVAVTIYRGNRWILTSDSITQISQVGLFKKQTSQLSLGNLEDVTFDQDSFIQSAFGFGTLHVETAGERSKFVFPFCPEPQKCAREIIQAHEDYIAANPEGERRDNQGMTIPQASQSSGQTQ